MIEGLYPQGTGAEMGMAAKGFLLPLAKQEPGAFISVMDEHISMARDLHLARRTPKRSRTFHEHIHHVGPQVLTIQTMRPAQPLYQSSPAAPAVPAAQMRAPTETGPPAETEMVPPDAATAAEAQPPPTTAPSPSPSPAEEPVADLSAAAAPAADNTRARRPKMPPPRRSYSVMDYEPVPPEQRPSARGMGLVLSELPAELHYAIFDLLDPIDATCLGLTNRHFYDIHRRLHGTVPLSVRRSGPNELEWAWHLAGYPLLGTGTTTGTTTAPGTSTSTSTTNTLGHGGGGSSSSSSLAALRVRGKGLCRKCGVARCELHKHIRDWVPERYEYCSVRDRFVPRAGEEARAKHCYMSNPRNSARCGRHRVRKSAGEQPPQH